MSGYVHLLVIVCILVCLGCVFLELEEECAVCLQLIAHLLTGRLSSAVSHLHGGLLHLAGLAHRGCPHPGVFPVRSSDTDQTSCSPHVSVHAAL